jgi:hypothetical protein
VTTPGLLLSVFTILSTSADAQPPIELMRAPIGESHVARTTEAYHHAVADAWPGGDTVAAFHFDGVVDIGGQRANTLGAGYGVALARIGRGGTVRWLRRFQEEAGAGQPCLIDVSRVIAMSDGGVILGAGFGLPTGTSGVLVRLDANGREVWRLAPTHKQDAFSHLEPLVDSRGRVIVLGSFYRGRYELSPAIRWSSSQRFTSFLAEVDAATGRVRWGRRLAGGASAHAVLPDGSIAVAGQFTNRMAAPGGALRSHGGADVYVARHDGRDGRMLSAFAWGTTGSDSAQSFQPYAAGGAAVLVESYDPGGTRAVRVVSLDAGGRELFSEPLAFGSTLVAGTASDRFTAIVPHDEQQARVRENEHRVAHRLRIVTRSEHGAPIAERDLSYGSLAFLTSVLHARTSGRELLLSGVLGELTGSIATRSESFYLRAAGFDTPGSALPPLSAARPESRFGIVERAAELCGCERGTISIDQRGVSGLCESRYEQSSCIVSQVSSYAIEGGRRPLHLAIAHDGSGYRVTER